MLATEHFTTVTFMSSAQNQHHTPELYFKALIYLSANKCYCKQSGSWFDTLASDSCYLVGFIPHVIWKWLSSPNAIALGTAIVYLFEHVYVYVCRFTNNTWGYVTCLQNKTLFIYFNFTTNGYHFNHDAFWRNTCIMKMNVSGI